MVVELLKAGHENKHPHLSLGMTSRPHSASHGLDMETAQITHACQPAMITNNYSGTWAPSHFGPQPGWGGGG